ncbi:MCE family protein, partial [Mycobacterium ulcerans]
WKGDPNSTLSGHPIPQLPPEPPLEQSAPPGPPPPAPNAAAEYDPATGTYTGPDGRQYTRSDLAQTAPKDQTWQSMLLPPPLP